MEKIKFITRGYLAFLKRKEEISDLIVDIKDYDEQLRHKIGWGEMTFCDLLCLLVGIKDNILEKSEKLQYGIETLIRRSKSCGLKKDFFQERSEIKEIKRQFLIFYNQKIQPLLKEMKIKNCD